MCAAAGFDFKEKFEEDIASPFSGRFSHSATVTVPAHGVRTPSSRPSATRRKMFSAVLGDMRRDGMRCPLETALLPVNNLEVRERVFSDGNLLLEAEKAEAALIFWLIGQTKRLVVAEFSFRPTRTSRRTTAADPPARRCNCSSRAADLIGSTPPERPKRSFLRGTRPDRSDA